MGVLGRGVERVEVTSRIVIADVTARFNRVRNQTLVADLQLGDVVGIGDARVRGG